MSASAGETLDQRFLTSDSGGCVVRRSARAKRLSLRVFPHGLVEVVAPTRVTDSVIQGFIRAHGSWIDRARRDLGVDENTAGLVLPVEILLAATAESWRVEYAATARRAVVKTGPDGHCIHLDGGDHLRAFHQLRRWLQRKGREVLLPWLAAIGKETGLVYGTVAVRRQRSRWGSCTARGDISLNCALLFLEPHLVRHVLIHELAHTRQLNHSRAFWRLVARWSPDYESDERELRRAWRSVPAWVNYDPY